MRLLYAGCIGLLTAASALDAGAQSSVCPTRMEIEQRAVSAPEGWEAAQVTSAVALASVTFYEGPPADKASLKFDSEDRQKRDWVAFWHFPPSPRGYWISCGYENTAAAVSRRLPESVRGCTVSYERKRRGAGGLPGIRSISCK